MIIYTSILSNYLGKSLALAESVLQHHPNVDFRIYLLDYKSAETPTSEWLREHLNIRNECQLPRFYDSLSCVPPEHFLCERFNIVEACTAVKPFIMHSLLEESHLTIYLDPDIVLYAPLDVNSQCQWDIQLIPHILQPAKVQGSTPLSERLFANFGIYNLGYLAVQPTEAGKDLINWWIRSCDLFGIANPSAGLYVDQKFFDFAPSFVENLSILRDPGCNVAWWNIFCDGRHLCGNGYEISYNNKIYPLRFFHFSNLDSTESNNPYIAKPLKNLDCNNKDIFLLNSCPLMENLFNNYNSRVNEFNQLLPEQILLTKRLRAERSVAERIKRRINDELYRIHAIETSCLVANKPSVHKYRRPRHLALPKSLAQAISSLIIKLLKTGLLKKHSLRVWSQCINNLISPSLFYYTNF